MLTTPLINTPLQWGGRRGREKGNRFNGFDALVQTVETVRHFSTLAHTQLKLGVNERRRSDAVLPHATVRWQAPIVTKPLTFEPPAIHIRRRQLTPGASR